MWLLFQLEAAGGGRLGAAHAGADAQEQVPHHRDRALRLKKLPQTHEL